MGKGQEGHEVVMRRQDALLEWKSAEQDIEMICTYVQLSSINQGHEGREHVVDSSRVKKPASIVGYIAHTPG